MRFEADSKRTPVAVAHATVGRVFAAALVAAALVSLAVTAQARAGDGPTYIAPELRAQAAKDPNATVDVIVSSTFGAEFADKVFKGLQAGKLRRKLGLVGAVAVELPAKKVAELAHVPGLTITVDAPVQLADYTSTELWPFQTGLDKLWGTTLKPAPKAPAIAIVDSGIDKKHPAFGDGSRIKARQVFTRLEQDSSKLDGRGHGTFVAGIAAGQGIGKAGAAPNADLIDLDVMDDSGKAYTSDVIAAAEWIYQNRASLNIRVANFSLHSMATGPFYKDPLNRAVEKLWFGGVFVVAAAGNYGSATGPTGVRHAPGNDPFVMTVGALDLGGTVGLGNDTIAPWSAYGRTYDGFAKPEVSAAGRYMVGPVPTGSTLVTERPDKLLGGDYMQLSGTSFAAPVVAGIAAQLLARNPSWTPDQVKGAIMWGARPVPQALPLQTGVGEVTALKSAKVISPPNPNAALTRFVVTDALTGAPTFDDVSWDLANDNPAWDSVSYSDVSWSGVSWDVVSYSDVSWSGVSYSDVSYSDASYEDASAADPFDIPAAVLDSVDAAELLLDPDLQP